MAKQKTKSRTEKEVRSYRMARITMETDSFRARLLRKAVADGISLGLWEIEMAATQICHTRALFRAYGWRKTEQGLFDARSLATKMQEMKSVGGYDKAFRAKVVRDCMKLNLRGLL